MCRLVNLFIPTPKAKGSSFVILLFDSRREVVKLGIDVGGDNKLRLL